MALDPARAMKVSAYVDGELGVEGMLEVEAWAREDDEVRVEVENLRALRDRVAAACSQSPPESLESRLRESIRTARETAIARQDGARAPAPRGPSWAWTAAAAILVLALALPRILEHPPESAGLLAEAEQMHARFVDVGEPQVRSDSVILATHKLNHQLQTNYGDDSLVSRSGRFKGWCNMRLKGVQDCRRFAFDIDGVPVSLFFLRATVDLPCALLHREIRSGERLYTGGTCGPYKALRWQQGPVTCIVLGDLPLERLSSFMDELQF